MDQTTYGRPNLIPVERPDRDPVGSASSISELIESLTGFIRRQFPLFVLIMGCALGVGTLYLLTMPAKFTAHAMLLIDSSKMHVLQQQQPVAEAPIDTAQVESQVEILKSDNIGSAVIKDEHLLEDPEFAGKGSGLLGLVGSMFSDYSGPLSEKQMHRRALNVFLKNRAITRVGRTYVIDLAYSSPSPARAASVANAVADAYINDQLDAKYQATRRASVWLQDRIKELRTQATDADRAVLDYKEKNHIVDFASAQGGPNGVRMLGDQQLGELNTQLGTARAATAEAKAKLQRIEDLLDRDVPDASVTEALHNEVITKLRDKYLDLASQQGVWIQRYGAGHQAAINLGQQMAQIQNAIKDELGRIAASAKSDYEIAKNNEEAVEKNLAALVNKSQSTNRDRLGLRDLESTANVYHTIYDNFLQRYMEAIQQQSFPITEARVISPADEPTRRSSPLPSVVLSIATLIGLALSFGAATIREATDRVLRTSKQVETALGLNSLAALPLLVAGAPNAKTWAVRGSAEAGKATARWTATSAMARPQPTVPPMRFIEPKDAFMTRVVDEPLSGFAEAFRSIKVAVDIQGGLRENKVIGITSTLPREGKSTVASNLAQLIADAGKKVVLIDGDLRNPTLTRALTPRAETGLLEILPTPERIGEAVHYDPRSGLLFLPAVVAGDLAHTNEVLASEAFRKIVDALRKDYDYVVIDFPPMAPVVDVRATTGFVDSYIFVVEWGRTRTNLIQDQLKGAPELRERIMGVVLNKANVKVLQRYEAYYGGHHYRRYYSQTGTTYGGGV